MTEPTQIVERWLLPLLLVAVTLLTWSVRENPFFWDTIQLASRHGQWYFDQAFSQVLLPDEIDSGHPPFFGMYIAAAWHLFGQSLLVSHLAMLPFLWGIIFLLFRIGRFWGGERFSWMPVILVLADPVFLGQSVLVSPDIVLVFGFLWALVGILERRMFFTVAGSLFLAAVSTRGMMCVFALYLFFLMRDKDHFSLRQAVSAAWPFVPSGLLTLAFLGYHYQVKGWVGYHPDMPWSPLFERAGWGDLPRNIAIWGHRLLDFGRVFLWAGLGWLLGYKGFRHFRNYSSMRQSFYLFILSLVIVSYPVFAYKGLNMHRYFLPAFISLSLVFYVALLASEISFKKRMLIYFMVVAGLFSGNFWIYPEKVSQGWDSTLAHLPYYSLRAEMLGYLDEQQIRLEEVGTSFPEIGPLTWRDLSGRKDGMTAKNLQIHRYILYSNVMNDFSDEEIDLLRGEWQATKTLRSRGIELTLYKR